MSAQTATMNNPYSSPINLASFFRKLVMLILFVAGIVALMGLFDYYQKNLSEILMTVFAVGSIGLAVGLGSRTVYYEFSGLTRTLVALVLLPLGLFAVGFFTNWRIGIGPLEPWLRGDVDWFQLEQLAGGFFVTTLALFAWRRTTASSEEFIPRARHSSHRNHGRVASSLQLPRFKLPQFKSIQLHLPVSWTRPRVDSRLRTNNTNHRSQAVVRHRPDSSRLVVRRPERPVRPKRSRKAYRNKSELQFSVHEEHRCPYCLDEVKRNDPRGVKECEICHSWHHADCWNITGMCQVPHLNE